MKPYQKRVVEERDALAEKVTKLDAFKKTPEFVKLPTGEAILLAQQLVYMRMYLYVLDERIARFERD